MGLRIAVTTRSLRPGGTLPVCLRVPGSVRALSLRPGRALSVCLRVLGCVRTRSLRGAVPVRRRTLVWEGRPGARPLLGCRARPGGLRRKLAATTVRRLRAAPGAARRVLRPVLGRRIGVLRRLPGVSALRTGAGTCAWVADPSQPGAWAPASGA
ncbi:hypothetical protein ACRJ4B_23730 [Streptomyces sp. GTA36]